MKPMPVSLSESFENNFLSSGAQDIIRKKNKEVATILCMIQYNTNLFDSYTYVESSLVNFDCLILLSLTPQEPIG